MSQRAGVAGLSGAAGQCRPALSADAASIAEAIVAAWRAGYVGLVSADFLQALDVERIAEGWRRVLASSRAFRQVLVCEGLVIGASSGGPASGATSAGVQPTRAELYSINVHPQHWGRGAGRLLLRASEGACARWVFQRRSCGSSRAMRGPVGSTSGRVGDPAVRSERRPS